VSSKSQVLLLSFEGNESGEEGERACAKRGESREREWGTD
jgi:hypothetical protein